MRGTSTSAKLKINSLHTMKILTGYPKQSNMVVSESGLKMPVTGISPVIVTGQLPFLSGNATSAVTGLFSAVLTKSKNSAVYVLKTSTDSTWIKLHSPALARAVRVLKSVFPKCSTAGLKAVQCLSLRNTIPLKIKSGSTLTSQVTLLLNTRDKSAVGSITSMFFPWHSLTSRVSPTVSFTALSLQKTVKNSPNLQRTIQTPCF